MAGAQVEVTGRYSRNFTPAPVDLNLQTTSQFTLPTEANRPVFVAPSAIVSATGAVSDADSRVSSALDQVLSWQGTLQSVTKDITLDLSPPGMAALGSTLFGVFKDLSYTLSSTRQQTNGFTGTTSGDPRTVAWSPGQFPRQQINLQLGHTLWGVDFSAYAFFLSGMVYTPLVGGDINGDGRFNDPAFVPDPTHTTDPTLAAEMRTLLQSTSGSARSCLLSQLGRIAGSNSCVGPWTNQFSLSASVDGARVHLSNRFHLQLYVANPQGGLDLLLHGPNHLHGWGTFNVPDPILLQPTGFNATAHQFAYTVNPSFGSVNRKFFNTSFQTPFQITLGASFTLGPSQGEQQLDQMLSPGRHRHRGSRLTAAEIRQQFDFQDDYFFNLPLQERDTVLLTRGQVQELQALAAEFAARVDSLWTPEAAHLAALGDQYEQGAELKQLRRVQAQASDLLVVFVKRLKRLLTASQWDLMPIWVKTLFEITGQ